jgi:hypothetical protein
MTREKAVDLVMNAQQGAAEGLGAGSTPGAVSGGKDSSSQQPRLAAMSASGVPGVARPRRGGPVMPVARPRQGDPRKADPPAAPRSA